jgi:lantibiotic modifying enzyme
VWYQALTLTERLATRHSGPPGQDTAAAERARRRWQRWREQGSFATDAALAQRLDQEGVGTADFLDLLGEPIEAVQQRSASPPSWLTELAHALAQPPNAEPLPLPQALRNHPMAGFLDLIEPLLRYGRQRLGEGMATLALMRPHGPFDPATAGELLCAQLPERLLAALLATLALELNVARLQGTLAGQTPAERFQSFLAQIRRREWALTLLQEYPVLARQLLGLMDRWVACSLEFLQRLSTDWEALHATFSPGHDIGPLVQIEGRRGDSHRGERLKSSVLRAGLLPQRLCAGEESEGVDFSGLGAVAGQLSSRPLPYWEGAGTDTLRRADKRLPMVDGLHRPRLQGADVDVSDYSAEILGGFEKIYRLLQDTRDELLRPDGLLARFGHDEVRVILRPTRIYARLLGESFHPDLLRDALERHRFFDWLWTEVKKRPELAPVIRAEQQALLEGDIPLFTTRPTSRDLWSRADERIVGVLDETGMALVERRLHQLSEEDLGRQQWIIGAALAAGTASVERAPQTALHVTGLTIPADAERLLAAACAIGDRLEALALRDGREVAWIASKTNLKQRQWSLVPAGPDLYEGLPGIAFFLAYLGVLSGEARYTELAQATLGTLRRQLERNPSSLTGIGAFTGWGGVLYTYAHLAALWQDRQWQAEIDTIIERLPDLIERDEVLDVIGGSAGCIGSLLHRSADGPSPRTLAVAVQCGDRLLARAQTMTHGTAWTTALAPERPLTGFSHGAAGIAWALLELAAWTGAPRFRTAALDAIVYERSLFCPAAGNWPDLRPDVPAAANSAAALCATLWCHGAPGIGLARLQMLRHQDDEPTRAEVTTAFETTLATGFGYNHSLCHGDLGNLDFLAQAQETLPEPRWREAVGRLTSFILATIQSHGWRCGTPQQIESPGLMTGLAGVGYGLLRLAAPARVPSVLVLAPPPAW